MTDPLRLIAFYFPQFHRIPENDEWWGEGFTDWVNVRKATPRFPGHYQPHVPGALGYYDLTCEQTRVDQAAMAQRFGIYGFCYYHYWFNGRRLLETPLEQVLSSGKPDFPFCICWANENWTRVWNGSDDDILLAQRHSEEDDLAHIRGLIRILKDPRYITVDGAPLVLIYRTDCLPNPERTAQTWRECAKQFGIPRLYLARVEGFTREDPRSIGFDAGVEFAPDWQNLGAPIFKSPPDRLAKTRLVPEAYLENNVFNYATIAERMLSKPEPDYKRFSGVTPQWDNCARRLTDACILQGSTPQKYEQWLRAAVERTMEKFAGDERMLFINAWNEWGEGCHLEPDLMNGDAYLEATLRVVQSTRSSVCRKT